MNNIILFLDDCRGIYIPSAFADSVRREYIDESFYSDLNYLADEDNIQDDKYWDVWSDVCDNLKITKDGKTFSLYQEGALFLIDYDNITEQESFEFFGEY